MNYVYGIVAALILAMGLSMWVQHKDNVAMSTTLKAVSTERDTALKDTQTLSKSAKDWEAATGVCLADAQSYKDKQKKIADENSAAIATARADAARSAASLAKASAKIAAAASAGPCAVILNTPVCVEALQ